MSYRWIRASEIGEYVYCRRAWWLRRAQGVETQNVRELRDGSKYHQQHGRLWQRAIWARRLAYAVLFSVVAFVIFQALTNWL